MRLSVGPHAAILSPRERERVLTAILLLRDDESLPAIDIVSDAGVTASLGAVGERRTVTGPDAALWAWLTGRTAGEGVTDAEGITFPLAG